MDPEAPPFIPKSTTITTTTTFTPIPPQPRPSAPPPPPPAPSQQRQFAANICTHCQQTTIDVHTHRCTVCSAPYCTSTCQSASWPTHKFLCRNPAAPVILILALSGQHHLLGTTCKHLIYQLRRHATVIINYNPTDAIRELTGSEGGSFPLDKNTIRAVILADGALLAVPKGSRGIGKLKKLVEIYCKSGGILVLGATFAGLVAPEPFARYVRETFGLPWKFGQCNRAIVHLNRGRFDDVTLVGDTRLAESYSQKAMWLKDVGFVNRMYVPREPGTTQSILFASEYLDCEQAPMCWAGVGWDGRLGYVGDLNCELESTAVVLAMCGLKRETLATRPPRLPMSLFTPNQPLVDGDHPSLSGRMDAGGPVLRY